MKLKFTITCLFLWVSVASAQWTSRANFPGVARAKSTAFTMGGKIYMMGGITNNLVILKDFWEYDIATNSWSQLPNFPGPERYGAVSFVLGNKGYIATGGNDFGYLDDIWEYDPSNASWIEKNHMPAGMAQHENRRVEAFSFVIGNLAFVGGGEGHIFMPNSTANIAFYDLWVYNPVTDSWIQKSGLPDFLGRNMAIGASINNKGYVGLGTDVQQSINRHTFWEYDPASDSWTSKANFPPNFTADAGVFVLNSNLYLVGGVNMNPVSLSNQFYKYDPIADTWTQLAPFNGSAIAGEFAVSTGTSAFAGGGYTASISCRNDLWEYTIATGIGEYDDQNVMATIYPNPSTGKMFFRSEKDISFVEVFDMQGKNILKHENVSSGVDASEWNAGVYTVKIVFEDGSLIYKQFMKTN